MADIVVVKNIRACLHHFHYRLLSSVFFLLLLSLLGIQIIVNNLIVPVFLRKILDGSMKLKFRKTTNKFEGKIIMELLLLLSLFGTLHFFELFFAQHFGELLIHLLSLLLFLVIHLFL